ncbi:MAG: type II toxin-antitoxin system RelE/ParE family toxin [Ignavibacteriae bacterium]|nr:type II toxin-antitoxin system RelE/ParE family toxin [Ignavibacteriota bacterium]NOG99321.1 type II toxin-antitoxin system RelE/ParE family toxin [Ignavibacteriota bacterium]
MKVKFLEPAVIEYQEAIDFYKLQTEGLEKRFISEIDKSISIIQNYPESFPEYTNHTRKAVVNIFPYNLIYSVVNEDIIILAVAHQHRKPNYWTNR